MEPVKIKDAKGKEREVCHRDDGHPQDEEGDLQVQQRRRNRTARSQVLPREPRSSISAREQERRHGSKVKPSSGRSLNLKK
jgi:hypothetical protein